MPAGFYESSKAQSAAALAITQQNNYAKSFAPTIINASREVMPMLDLSSTQTPSNELIQSQTQKASDELSASVGVAVGPGASASAALNKGGTGDGSTAGALGLTAAGSSPVLYIVGGLVLVGGLILFLKTRGK